MLALHLKQKYGHKKLFYNFNSNINDIFQILVMWLLKYILFFNKQRNPKVDILNFKEFLKIKLEWHFDNINGIVLFINGQILNIKQKNVNESKVKGEYYVKTERYNDWLNMTVPLPVEVINTNMRITYINGFLELVIYKVKKEPP